MPPSPRPKSRRLLFAGLLVAGLLPACASPDAGSGDVIAGSGIAAADPGASSRIVRLHTRLMVAGLACGPAWQDPQAFRRYAAFVSRNAPVLSAAQRDVARQLGGISDFDVEHTALSNRESLRMRQLGTLIYCSEMQAPFYAAMGSAAEELAALPD
jgi:hypothetical protein